MSYSFTFNKQEVADLALVAERLDETALRRLLAYALALEKTYSKRGENKAGKQFSFTQPDAIETAYIVERNETDDRFLHDVAAYALALERARDKAK